MRISVVLVDVCFVLLSNFICGMVRQPTPDRSEKFSVTEYAWPYQTVRTVKLFENWGEAPLLLAWIQYVMPCTQSASNSEIIINTICAQRDRCNQGKVYEDRAYEHMSKVTEHALLQLIDQGKSQALANESIKFIIDWLQFRSITVQTIPLGAKMPGYWVLFKKVSDAVPRPEVVNPLPVLNANFPKSEFQYSLTDILADL